MDEAPIDLSGPIDLTTLQRKNSDDVSKTTRSMSMSGHPVGRSNYCTLPQGIERMEQKPLPIAFSNRVESRQSPQTYTLIPPPTPLVLDGDLLAGTSPGLDSPSPPIARTSPINCFAAVAQTGTISSLSQSDEDHSDADAAQEKKRRYMSASRPFNILAKKLIGDIDCPPRPGNKVGAASAVGGACRTDQSEPDADADAAYRERRSKNNLAARRSRDKRKLKCSLLTEKTAHSKQQSIDILKDIAHLQQMLLDQGYNKPLPYSDEVGLFRDELYMYS